MTVRALPTAKSDAAGRIAAVKDLLTGTEGCAVTVFDAARNFGDAERELANLGIPIEGHSLLRSGVLAEFVALSDAWLVSDVALEASIHGSASRTLLLRTGEPAELHLIDIDDVRAMTAAIFVPGAGGTIAGTPPATAIAASSRVGVIHSDPAGVITSVSASTLHLLGHTVDPFVGGAIVNLVHPDDQEAAIINWSAAKDQRGVALRWRCRVVSRDGSPLWAELTLTNDIDESGVGDVRVEIYDIAREVAATDALAAEKELLGLLTETLPVGVAKFDVRGRIEHANSRLAQLLAPLSPDDALGRAMRGELEDPDLCAAFTALLHEGVAGRVVVEHHGAGSEVRHLEWTISPAHTDAGALAGGVVCIADVTEAHELRSALEHRATTDALTRCLNRAGTIAALEHELATLGTDEGVGLLYIDLDEFKEINDAFGHAIGDAVLEVVANRLRGALRPIDLVGRLGGDEFVVIAPRLRSQGATLALATRISHQLQGPAAIDGMTVAIAASIGVAWTSTGTASSLLGAADAAMYRAKENRSTVAAG